MFGAKDSATQSRGGKLLQLRALDWDVDGPFRNFATIVVYHPNPGNGNAWANLGFTGWMAAITGFSEQQIGMSGSNWIKLDQTRLAARAPPRTSQSTLDPRGSGLYYFSCL